jgi:hypothetical protein
VQNPCTCVSSYLPVEPYLLFSSSALAYASFTVYIDSN